MATPTHSPARPIDFHHPELNNIYEDIKISPDIPQALKHERLMQILQELKKKFPRRFHVEKIGESVENRDICMVRFGTGPRKILMWSQMHGNEPTATNALVDIFNYLLTHKDDEFVQELLNGATLYAIPMLNPDGAEKNHRRNAQGIDINRDARDLASPEGRLLKSIRYRLDPQFGLNLHDQNGRRTVGNTNKIVAIALLAPPFDENENDNRNRIDAKKLAAVAYQALSPYIYGHMARYDASYMPRAFGDSMQYWGTSTLLLEAGGWYEDDPDFLVKMKFIAILEVCHAVATESYQQANPGIYDTLPQNDKELFDLMIRNATIIDGTGQPPFRSDIGINYTFSAEGDRLTYRGTITDLGDMELFAAKEIIDGTGMLVVPGLIGLLPQEQKIPLRPEQVQTWLGRGYTTLLVQHAMQNGRSLRETVKTLCEDKSLDVNIGFLTRLDDLANIPLNEQATVLGDALFDGALAVLKAQQDGGRVHPLVGKILTWLHRKTLDENDLQTSFSWPELLAQGRHDLPATLASSLGLLGRGRIRIGDFADIAMYAIPEGGISSISAEDLRYVIVNGRPVLPHSERKAGQQNGMVLLP